jgi:carbamoyltransferase
MTNKPAYVLGINAYDHDASACLLRNGELGWAIAKERITREKHDGGFYKEPVEYCLNAEGVSIDDIDLVVRNCYILPPTEMERRMLHQPLRYFTPDESCKPADYPKFFKDVPVEYVSHHLAHAYSAFAPSPFEEGVVMVVDGVGSYRSDVTEPVPRTDIATPLARESESYYSFSGSRIETLKKVWMEPVRGFLSEEFFNMPGLGAYYSRASTYIFGDWNKCGELMGLAPYGRPGKVEPLLEMDGQNLRVLEWPASLDKPWGPMSGRKWEGNAAIEHWQDLAWRVQDDAERVLLARARWLRETTRAKNLVIAGGVALNCVANGRIAREAGFDNVWIQPAAGDDGIAIGCALYGRLALQKHPRNFVMKHAYLGREYSGEEISAARNAFPIRFETAAETFDDICAETAKRLSEGKVVGWYQGRSEFGPRALGNRSLLADPRTSEMKDRLNKRIKFRQSFRPFAPIVLAERSKEIFEGDHDSPFMLMAQNVRPEWRDKIPAIVHVDGTARVQTVCEETNPRLYRLLKEFEKLTGVPVLLNTSYNVKGEPIVETPADAVYCFLNTNIDCLVMKDMIVTKAALYDFISPVFKFYRDVAAKVRAGVEAG